MATIIKSPKDLYTAKDRTVLLDDSNRAWQVFVQSYDRYREGEPPEAVEEVVLQCTDECQSFSPERAFIESDIFTIVWEPAA